MFKLPSVTQILTFQNFRKMRHFQAMEAIKSLVPESVRHELTPPSSGTTVNPVQYSSINRSHHPPPPINQAQAIQMMQDNLNINVEKGYPSHLSMPTRSPNPVPSDHPEPLNPSQWDPTGKNINPNVAGSTQALNIPVATSTHRNPTGATNVPPTTRFVTLLIYYIVYIHHILQTYGK